MMGRQPMSVLHNSKWLLLTLGIYPWLVAQLVAQPAGNPPTLAASAAPLPGADGPSIAPPAKSPVDLFRELLAMDSAEREERLEGRPPTDRKAILAKLQEYESLTPEERELRLSTTQLHWYMLRFMKTPATNWSAELTMIPKADRALVEDRINQWIILPPQLQAEVLEYETTKEYFLGGHVDAKTQKQLQNLPENERREMEERLARWNSLAFDQRRRMTDQFNHFFELTPTEKDKTLRSLSESEREQMKMTLQSFERLPKATRELCLQSFGRFAEMSAHERRQFLKNVERWQEMSPSERDAWQRLVRYLEQTPPIPLGMDPVPPLMRINPHIRSPASTTGIPLATNNGR
jgi:hypothetical protein